MIAKLFKLLRWLATLCFLIAGITSFTHGVCLLVFKNYPFTRSEFIITLFTVALLNFYILWL
jgi:hypothetical protein